MAWNDLKATVAAVIRTNGNQEITGALLQSTLNSIIDQVGANATFKGVAIPTTNPGVPDGPLFYIAYEKGIYANFNAINITEEDGLVIILYSSNWNKINIPLASKDELVQVRSDFSEAITSIEQEQIQGGVYDVSSHNNGAVFESLSALLKSPNLSTLIPSSVRHGGMIIRFIQGSITKRYVTYAYSEMNTKSDVYFANVKNWRYLNMENITGLYFSDEKVPIITKINDESYSITIPEGAFRFIYDGNMRKDTIITIPAEVTLTLGNHEKIVYNIINNTFSAVTIYDGSIDVILLLNTNGNLSGMLQPVYIKNIEHKQSIQSIYFSDYKLPVFSVSGTNIQVTLPSSGFRFMYAGGGRSDNYIDTNTYTVENNMWLVFDTNDNTIKVLDYTSYGNYIVLAHNSDGQMDSGLLVNFYNTQKSKEYAKEYSNYLITTKDLVTAIGSITVESGNAKEYRQIGLGKLYLYPKEQNTPYILRTICKKTNSTSTPKIEVKFVNDLYKYNNEYPGVVNAIDSMSDDYQLIEVRIPPFICDGTRIVINIYAGLSFKTFEIVKEGASNRRSNIRYCAHLGAVFGWNTIPAYEMAGLLGYNACIANLRQTKDGVYVCSHNNNFVALSDGLTYYISKQDYDDINTLGWYDSQDIRYGESWRTYFGGNKLPKLEDFLHICSKYGMHPIISFNDAIVNWQDINAIFKKFGYSGENSFTIKSFDIATLASIYTILGNQARYIYDCPRAMTIQDVDNVYSLNLGNAVKGIEAIEISPSIASYAIEKDLVLSLIDTYYTGNDTSVINEYISNGVTEITTDSLCQSGMMF